MAGVAAIRRPGHPLRRPANRRLPETLGGWTVRNQTISALVGAPLRSVWGNADLG